MMAKIRFKRSSRSSREAMAGNVLQALEQRNNDNIEQVKDKNAGTNGTITSIVNNDQPLSAKESVVGDKKSTRKQKSSILRLFFQSSSTTPKASSNIDSTPPPPPASLSSSTSQSSSSSLSSSSSSFKTTGKTKSSKKEHKTNSNETDKKESTTSRSRYPWLSSSATANSNNKQQPHSSANSSSKQIISIPNAPYEIEATEIDGIPYVECPLCVLLVDYNTTPDLRTCSHRTCLECMQRYLKTEINHSRLKITCPICSEPLQQQVIREILHDDKFYFKYESFMLRKVLAAEPDARWCPAPDCGYAVLATGCASCPRLVCGREGCNTDFCYHCKQEWHPNQTCNAASIQRNKRNGFVLNAFNMSDLISSADDNESVGGGDGASTNAVGGSQARGKDDAETSKSKSGRKSSRASQQANANSSSLRPEDIKECPVCSSRIIKMNDGSCNHMTCSICDTDFCWLCMKEISDLHYFSPSGCTFWGKKPWSRKKKLLWRLGMLVGAPICIIFIAGIAVPAIVIGIPVWAARKLHTRLEKEQFSRYRKNAIITGGVLLSFVVSPIISAMALAIGIPILLGYVYGVVPLSLCRSSGGCLSSNPSVENLNEFQHNQSSSVINQARDRLQRLQIQTAQQEYKRQQMKSEPHKSRDGGKRSNSSSNQATPQPFSDIISVDMATNSRLETGTNQNHAGGESIGEPSMYMSNISLETNSIGNVTNIVEHCSRNSASGVGGCGMSATGCEDHESASNVVLPGSIKSHKADDVHSTRALAGSIVSKESGGYTLVPAEVHTSTSAAPTVATLTPMRSLDEVKKFNRINLSARPSQQDISGTNEFKNNIKTNISNALDQRALKPQKDVIETS